MSFQVFRTIECSTILHDLYLMNDGAAGLFALDFCHRQWIRLCQLHSSSFEWANKIYESSRSTLAVCAINASQLVHVVALVFVCANWLCVTITIALELDLLLCFTCSAVSTRRKHSFHVNRNNWTESCMNPCASMCSCALKRMHTHSDCCLAFMWLVKWPFDSYAVISTQSSSFPILCAFCTNHSANASMKMALINDIYRIWNRNLETKQMNICSDIQRTSIVAKLHEWKRRSNIQKRLL